MKLLSRSSLTALAVSAALAVPSITYATNGMFKIGIGAKARSMGGVGIALPQDSHAAGINPAGLAFVQGNRVDAGLELFNPVRDGRVNATGLNAITGVSAAADSGQTESGGAIYAIPNMGMTMHMGSDMSAGISIYGNGGMNTTYGTNIFAGAFGGALGQFIALADNPAVGGPGAGAATQAAVGAALNTTDFASTLGVNLSQLIIAPGVSFKVSENHALGASVLLGYQQFRAYGLGMFRLFSSNGAKLTNNGNDNSFGAGLKVGYSGKLGDSWMIGATYSSKVYMQEFDEYAGLFAEQGDMDIPANFGVGVSFKPNDTWTFAFDWTRIEYGGVDSIANKGPTGAQFAAALLGGLQNSLNGLSPNTGLANQLGTDAGYGFGWEDTDVFKLGASYKYNESITFNVGVNHNSEVYDDDQTLFNVLAPGLVRTHATLGVVYSPTSYSEVTFGYMRAFAEDQANTFSTATVFGAGSYDASNRMDQHAVEISYGLSF